MSMLMKRIALVVIPLVVAAIVRQMIRKWEASSEEAPGSPTEPVSIPA